MQKILKPNLKLEKDLWRFTNYIEPASSIQLQSIGISISIDDVYKKVELPVKK